MSNFMDYDNAEALFEEIGNKLGEKASISLLKDTAGWVGKNYWNENELTFRVNGSTATITKTGGVTNIQITGKNGAYGGVYISSTKLRNFFANIAGKKCILSFDIKSDTAFTGVIGSVNKYDVNVTTEWKNIEQIIEDTASFPEFDIYAGGNDLPLVSIKNLMLRDASITDSTFEPYHKSVEEWGYTREEAEKVGAFNIIPYPYKQGSSNNRGIDFTDNGDSTLTLNGTQNNVSSNAVHQMLGSWGSTNLIFPAGHYVIKTNNSNPNIILTVSYDSTFLGRTTNGILEIDAPNGITYMTCEVAINSPKLTNELVKPQVSYHNGEYQPPAMTNRELTEEVNGEELSITTTKTINTNELNKIIRQGRIVCVCIGLSGVTAEAYETIASVPASCKPEKGMYFNMNGTPYYFDTNGNLKPTSALNNSAVRGQWVYCL